MRLFVLVATCVLMAGQGSGQSDNGMRMEDDGIAGVGYFKVFSHNTSGGLFPNKEAVLESNPTNADADLFSILYKLDEFKDSNGNFHFKLCYPELKGIGGKSCNEWRQSSNPTGPGSIITGFSPIHLAFDKNSYNQPWKGLGRNLPQYQSYRSLIDDAPTGSYWYSAIGAFGYWPAAPTIPGPRLPDPLRASAVTKVELYVFHPGSDIGNSDCPRTLTYGGGSQQYRFVEHIDSLPPPQYLPCTGDIDRCVYTAHRKFYCMNGNKPDYTPHEVIAGSPLTPVIKNVSTYAGTFDDSSPICTTLDGTNEPLTSLKLFPNEYGGRYVWGGFILKTTKSGGGGVTTHKCGFTDQLPHVRHSYIDFITGEGITEASGSAGAVIDQLTLGVTPNPANPAVLPSFVAVGGFNGGGFFATPDPSLEGPCSLLGLTVQTSTTFGGTEPFYIKAAEFHWQCVGRPISYGTGSSSGVPSGSGNQAGTGRL